MEQRSPEEVTRVLDQQEEIECFGSENSEEEQEDAIGDADIDISEMLVCDLESSSESESKITNEAEKETEEKSGNHRLDRVKDIQPEIQGHRSVYQPCVIGAVVSSRTPLEFWSALFTDDILGIILKYTNVEIERYTAKRAIVGHSSFRTISLNELRAFIGLLYICGVQNNNKVNLSEIWSREFGSTLCKVTMSQQRFEFISRRLRFHDKVALAVKPTADTYAPIRQIWNIFLSNCRSNYNPSELLIIDEQLLAFRGLFAARSYGKFKSVGCGIKIFTINDAKTFYMYNALPYSGKVSPQVDETVTYSHYVRKLSESIENTDRTVNCDNLYDKTKHCENIFNQLCENYSCARTTRRWSMRFFLGMLDQASVNAGILYNFLAQNELTNRREFLKSLALSLIKPHLQERASKPSLQRSLADGLREILSAEAMQARPTLGSDKLDKRKRCCYCKHENDRKTQYCCAKCKKPVCEKHRFVCCVYCME